MAEASTARKTGRMKGDAAQVKKLLCTGHGTGMLYNLSHIEMSHINRPAMKEYQ